VARYALIDGYLDTMRTEIRWRQDLDDLVSEMEDHLYSTVENLLATGVEPKAAQRTTLDRFGEPKVLAKVYASTNSGGIAVPTKNTIRAGTFALVAAALWLIAATSYLLTETLDNWDNVDYYIFSVSILVAGVLTLLAMVGVGERLGGLGALGMVGLAITGLGVLASVIAWALPLWMGIQGVGMLVFGTAVLMKGIAPRWGTLLVSSGFALGTIVWIVGTTAELGDVDQYGDYKDVWAAAVVVGLAIVTAGLVGWGLWLRNEEPIDIDNDSPAIAA
jgi:hypothetical protein